MTGEEHSEEAGEEAIEDLEAPAAAQAGMEEESAWIGPCQPTNKCKPVNTVVHCPDGITQGCRMPTCHVTEVYYS
jgi:hypothetical protein